MDEHAMCGRDDKSAVDDTAAAGVIIASGAEFLQRHLPGPRVCNTIRAADNSHVDARRNCRFSTFYLLRDRLLPVVIRIFIIIILFLHKNITISSDSANQPKQ